jgi:FkbM family methyltransferase
MFGDSRPECNGELAFYEKIKPHINSIFDVGSRDISLFMDFPGEVHYFDPNPNFIDALSKNPSRHSTQIPHFNSFGLGNENTMAYYYPGYESFYDRVISCEYTDINQRVEYEIRRADRYIWDNSIQNIDFLKIDTEGHEYAVLLGFGEELARVQTIQFEYGGTWKDSYTTLAEVAAFLRTQGFEDFYYLDAGGELMKIVDFADHYQYCNIVTTRNPKMLGL